MEPNELLELWITTHGPLSEAEQKSFLGRSEVEQLCQRRKAEIVNAVGRAKKLDAILHIAQTEGWWFAGDPCDLDELSFCAKCKPHPYPQTVYMTKGWSSAFHKSPTCTALNNGQNVVANRGGAPAAVEIVHIQVALASGRQACQVCL